MEHIWKVADEHLAIIDDVTLPRDVRDFAVQVVAAAFDHEPPERTLARTFELLHRLVDRDDPLLGELLPFVPIGDVARTRAAVTKLAARAIERGSHRVLRQTIWSMLSLEAPVPFAWVKALLDDTADADLRLDFAYLFFDWSQSKGADAEAGAMMLSERPALRKAYDEVRTEYGGED